jgi:hypothetical protein
VSWLVSLSTCVSPLRQRHVACHNAMRPSGGRAKEVMHAPYRHQSYASDSVGNVDRNRQRRDDCCLRAKYPKSRRLEFARARRSRKSGSAHQRGLPQPQRFIGPRKGHRPGEARDERGRDGHGARPRGQLRLGARSAGHRSAPELPRHPPGLPVLDGEHGNGRLDTCRHHRAQ